MNPYDIVKSPLDTEKTNKQKENYNQFSFEVDRRANRIEISNAVETLFNVKVAQVRTIQVKGNFFTREGRAAAIPVFVNRLMNDGVNGSGAFVDPPPRLARAQTMSLG